MSWPLQVIEGQKGLQARFLRVAATECAHVRVSHVLASRRVQEGENARTTRHNRCLLHVGSFGSVQVGGNAAMHAAERGHGRGGGAGREAPQDLPSRPPRHACSLHRATEDATPDLSWLWHAILNAETIVDPPRRAGNGMRVFRQQGITDRCLYLVTPDALCEPLDLMLQLQLEQGRGIGVGVQPGAYSPLSMAAYPGAGERRALGSAGSACVTRVS